jgi:hypothetical protein
MQDGACIKSMLTKNKGLARLRHPGPIFLSLRANPDSLPRISGAASVGGDERLGFTRTSHSASRNRPKTGVSVRGRSAIGTSQLAQSLPWPRNQTWFVDPAQRGPFSARSLRARPGSHLERRRRPRRFVSQSFFVTSFVHLPETIGSIFY